MVLAIRSDPLSVRGVDVYTYLGESGCTFSKRSFHIVDDIVSESLQCNLQVGILCVVFVVTRMRLLGL